MTASLSLPLSVLFALAILAAMLWDIARFEIPDQVSLVLVAGGLAALLAGGGDWMGLLLHLGVAAGAFLFGLVLFMAGLWGGGDVKLLAAVSLWFGWPLIMPYLQLTFLLGGLVALLLLLFRRLPLPAAWQERRWLAQLHDPARGMPYGLALGGAALLMMTRLPL